MPSGCTLSSTGVVQGHQETNIGSEFEQLAATAEQVYVLKRDLPPLLVLMVAVTGRNVESIKELPVEHTILEGKAVQLQLTKRRRGPRHWHETVTWEIGPPDRVLHTPGGLYLLLHQLMAAGRRHSHSQTLWSVWRHQLMPDAASWSRPHGDPFGNSLSGGSAGDAAKWATKHNLTADPAYDGAPPEPLSVNMLRLRTSIEVRRTKQLGGHLPSAARSNTVPVLFRNYLQGDPTTREWATEVITDALIDAERSALAAHRSALGDDNTQPTVLNTPANRGPEATPGLNPAAEQGAWTSCTDPQDHPRTHKPCASTFLDCFHCSNCLVTTDHLPRLLSLLTALRHRRQHLDEHDWAIRYGPAFSAIRLDILTKFTPAQIAAADTVKPDDSLLDLVENPWETP